jgi:Family of unknown function (DUF6932)
VSIKQEFPPLLGAGFHTKTIAELRIMCVDAFLLSKTRADIMAGLERFVSLLQAQKIEGNLWIDGGFVTEKIDPEDVDIVLCYQIDFYRQASHSQQELINRLPEDDFKTGYHCDSYAFSEYPKGDPLYNYGEWERAYWHRQFGFSRRDDYKGIVVLELR